MRNGATYSFYLSHDEVDQLNAEATERGISRNELLRQFLREGLQRSPTGSEASIPKRG